MDMMLEMHDFDCECEDCATPLGELVATRGFPCSQCGHHHHGEHEAYRCSECPCETRPDWYVKAPQPTVAPQARRRDTRGRR
jgi:hypothetical protein